MTDLHDLTPGRFLAEVHSFASWFQAIAGAYPETVAHHGFRP